MHYYTGGGGGGVTCRYCGHPTPSHTACWPKFDSQRNTVSWGYRNLSLSFFLAQIRNLTITARVYLLGSQRPPRYSKFTKSIWSGQEKVLSLASNLAGSPTVVLYLMWSTCVKVRRRRWFAAAGVTRVFLGGSTCPLQQQQQLPPKYVEEVCYFMFPM